MNKLYLSTLALLSSAAPAFAQDALSRLNPTIKMEDAPVITRRACGTMDLLQAQLAADPAQARRMADIETQT